ncbi:glycosyltransferase family 39 protein [Patescibacteria group bacterium]|nr:glycosyltransferase family 39 protein [Patescibacteria group bacterium]
MKNKWLSLLLILTFIKGIVWVILTPIFQAPDENVHWGATQYIAEKLKPPTKWDIITSRELSAVANIVRFNWVESHPVWLGLEEGWIEKLNQIDPQAKTEFSFAEKQGGHKLPQGYSWLGSIVYRLFFNQSFLVRFYALRLVSVLLSLITVYIVYKAARLVLKAPLSLAVAFMAVMQPMYSAISSAVTYDSLAVLVVSGYIFLSLKFIKSKNTKWQWLALLVAVAGIAVKTQLVGLIFTWPFLLTKKQRYFWLLLPVVVLILLQLMIFKQLWGETLIWLSHEPVTAISDYILKNYRSLSAEVFPWYWGVFGWLEKTMPLWIYRGLVLI